MQLVSMRPVIMELHKQLLRSSDNQNMHDFGISVAQDLIIDPFGWRLCLLNYNRWCT